MRLFHKNPSAYFANLLLIYLFYGVPIYGFTVLLIYKFELSDFKISYIVFMTQTIIMFALCIVCIYVRIRRYNVISRKMILSNLAYAQHETTVINKRVVEVFSVHMDNPTGLKTLAAFSKSKNRIAKASFFLNEAIDSIVTSHSRILGDPQYSNVKYIIGESHHVRLFKKKLEELEIRTYPLKSPYNTFSTFILMWLYNIRVYKKLSPSFKIGRVYRFEIPIEWLSSPYNQVRLLKHKRSKTNIS